MRRFASCIVFGIISTLLASCETLVTTPEFRQAAIQEAGDAYGFTFEITREISDMPAGAVFVFDSDGFKKSVTEVYECYFDHDTIMDIRAFKHYYNNIEFFHIDKERRVIVAQGFPGFGARYEYNEVIYDFYAHTTMKQKREVLKKINDYYSFDEYKNITMNSTYKTQELYDYIRTALKDPISRFSSYRADMSDEEIDEMIYLSLHETDTIYSVVYSQKLVPVTVGNRYNRTEIPEEAWIVFNTPDHFMPGDSPEWFNTVIRDDLLFLLDTYYKELH